jgi:hypothetical protein
MVRSTKLGIAGILMIAGSLCSSLWRPEQPISLVFAVISCVFCFLAAHTGSKWWLAVPGIVIGVAALLLFVGLQAA